MKNQLKFTVKISLRRGLACVLLLLGVCTLSLTLAQGNRAQRDEAASQGGAIPGSVVNAASEASLRTSAMLGTSNKLQTAAPVPNAPDAGAWTASTPYPTTLARYASAQTATHLYIFGGVANGTRVSAVNRLNLSTLMWESRAPMPWASEAPTCALMDATGIVYCAEGDTGSGFASYNTATDSWTSPLAPVPGTNHYGSASGAFNARVFVAGGSSAFTNAVQVYNVATNTWSAGTPAPDGFVLAGYQQIGQFLYTVGGWTGGVPTGLTTTNRLDMTAALGAWSSGVAFPSGRSDFGLAYDAGTNKLYAIGGDTQGGGFFNSTDLVEELDLTTWGSGAWVASPANLPSIRQANHAGFYALGDIWSVAGINGVTFAFLSEVLRRTNGPAPGLCDVCHKRATTITLQCSGVQYAGHLAHGDTIGACAGPPL
ncbi:MAG: hypothetical protein ACJ8EL_18200 [Rhizomicrobium sp.]